MQPISPQLVSLSTPAEPSAKEESGQQLLLPVMHTAKQAIYAPGETHDASLAATCTQSAVKRVSHSTPRSQPLSLQRELRSSSCGASYAPRCALSFAVAKIRYPISGSLYNDLAFVIVCVT